MDNQGNQQQSNQTINNNLFNCTDCGRLMSKNAYQCPNCGNPNAITRQINMQYNQQNTNMNKNPKIMKKLIICGMVVVVLVIGIIILYNKLLSGGAVSYKNVVKEYLSVRYEEQDRDKMYKYSFTSRGDSDAKEEYYDEAYDNLQFIKMRYGSNISFSNYEIVSEQKINSSEYEDVEDEFEERFGKKINISDARHVEVRCDFECDNASEGGEKSLYCYIVKISGKWYIMDDFLGIYMSLK